MGKKLEFSKYHIAKHWLYFLEDYEDKLKNLKFEEVFDKSFLDHEQAYYRAWIDLILKDIDKEKLDYDGIVKELKISIKHSAEILGIPE